LHRKGLVIGILILMLGVNIGSTFAGDVDVKTMSSVGFDGDTLYVGGSGPNNYTKIQDAVDNASDGDTVFVYEDRYYENLVINTSIFLIGDDKDSTIIDGRYIDNVIGVYAPNTWIEDFTIRCSGDDSHLTSAGIYLVSNNNHILNCVFYDNHWALKVTNFNFLNNCYFHDNTYSVSIYGNGNEIINNRFSMNGFGLAVGGNSNTISNNIISDVDQDEALYLTGNDNSVINNHIANNYVGVDCHSAKDNNIERNNFIDNEYQAVSNVEGPIFEVLGYRNKWDSNYWGDYFLSGILPKFILGAGFIAYLIGPFVLYLPYFFIEVDWNPAQEPYDIGV